MIHRQKINAADREKILWGKNFNFTEKHLREYRVSINTRKMLKEIHKTIKQAGGGTSLESLGETSLKDLLVIFSRNSINLEAEYIGPL